MKIFGLSGRASSLAIALLLSLSAPALSGCSLFEEEKETPLPGVRISVLEMEKSAENADAKRPSSVFEMPSMWQNESWTQPGGYPNHAMQHLALSDAPLKKIWTADIGDGGKESLPLTAQPVIADGLIYTLDTDSQVSAFEIQNGKRAWKNSVRPAKVRETTIGGGLAVSGGTVFVTNGYNEIVALNARTGGVQWRKNLSAPARSAPTVVNNRVYAQTLDNHVTGFDTATGSETWTYEGYAEIAGLVNAASPAADDEIVIAPMTSGEIGALRVANGSVAWSDTLSPSLQAGGGAALPDIAALPILDNGTVFAVSYGGRTAAFEQSSGTRLWTRDIGGAKTPWLAGNFLFLLTSNAELVALEKQTGTIAWVKPLDMYDKDKNVRNSLLWNGPLLAGNRLVLTSSDDKLVEVAAQDGTLIRKTDCGGHIAVPPVIAGSVLYLLDESGTLSAWR